MLRPPHIVIVTGVVGSGKSTVGRALAVRLGWRFHDADDLHTADNVERMRRNEGLTDELRVPWLLRLRAVVEEAARERSGAVIACSALKKRYREMLAGGIEGVRFVHLTGDSALLRERIEARAGHFAGADLLDSQLEALEPPDPALTLDVRLPVDAMVDVIERDLRTGHES